MVVVVVVVVVKYGIGCGTIRGDNSNLSSPSQQLPSSPDGAIISLVFICLRLIRELDDADPLLFPQLIDGVVAADRRLLLLLPLPLPLLLPPPILKAVVVVLPPLRDPDWEASSKSRANSGLPEVRFIAERQQILLKRSRGRGRL